MAYGIERLETCAYPLGVSERERSVIGQTIERLRRAKGYEKRSDFAKAIKVGYQQVADWETRRESLDTASLFLLAKFFRVDVNELLAGIDPAYDEIVGAAASDLPRQTGVLQRHNLPTGSADVETPAPTDREQFSATVDGLRSILERVGAEIDGALRIARQASGATARTTRRDAPRRKSRR